MANKALDEAMEHFVWDLDEESIGTSGEKRHKIFSKIVEFQFH